MRLSDWLCVQIWKHMGRKLLKTVQTITTFRNPLADGGPRGNPSRTSFGPRTPVWKPLYRIFAVSILRRLITVGPLHTTARMVCWCLYEQAEDDQERFERMQKALLMANPESVAFYNAQMRTRRRVCIPPSSIHSFIHFFHSFICIRPLVHIK